MQELKKNQALFHQYLLQQLPTFLDSPIMLQMFKSCNQFLDDFPNKRVYKTKELDTTNDQDNIVNHDIVIIITITRMNKLRGQKKDVTRILKAMKLEQSTKYNQTINLSGSNSIDYKQIDRRVIYESLENKKLPQYKESKRRKYRYQKTITENQVSQSLPFRQQRSLDAKKINNFLKISEHYKDPNQSQANPYANNNKRRQFRQSTYKNKRNYTQQSSFAEPLRKTIHLKTVEPLDPGTASNFLTQAKSMANSGSLSESQHLIQRILRQDPMNKQALYLSGVNNFKQMSYIKSLLAFNKLLELDPMYNKNAYVMSCICYSNKGQNEEAMLRINTCLQYFPDYYDAHFQKAKLFLRDDDTQNGIKCLKKALKLARDPYQCCLKLCECYQKQQMHDLALKLYDKVFDRIMKQPSAQKENNIKCLCLLKKAQCQKKLLKFQQYVVTLQTYIKMINADSVVNMAKIYYQIGYGYYKLENYPNAIMKLQQVIQEKSKKQSTDGLILLTLINIRKRDFYEAHHCLIRRQHMQIYEKDIEFYQKFCEGVLSLMKRKFEQGLKKLIEIQHQVGEIVKDQFHIQVAKIYPLYLAYAYFCLGRTDKCIKFYKSIIQENHNELIIFKKGIEYNLALCEGIQQYKHKKLGAAKAYFQKSVEIYPGKPEGFLYLAITLIHIYLKDFNEGLLKRARSILQSCVQNLKELNNNYAASAYYVKAVLSAFLGDWDNALNEIDQSIERSEDNDHKSFYLRALILACCQNFRQAINQVSIALSLNNKQPAYYLLRSKCTQIDGDGNRAFVDLQEYISLSPEDAEIHKYAGHLLFENGAFQDAIQAYQNGDISVDISNFDVFLTRSKTYFLLSDFQKCIADMEIASKLKPKDGSIIFDIEVIKILNNFFKEDKLQDIWIQKAKKSKQQLENVSAKGQQIDYGRIFKKIEISMLLSLFLFYMEKYKEAARQFKQTITLKQSNLGNQSQFQQQEKERQFFIAQMNYNRAVCFLMINEDIAAQKALQKCKIQQNSKKYERYVELKRAIETKKENSEYIELFSQKNKISRSLNQISIKLNNYNDAIKLKLSIPFPKVEPPQINPKFQLRVLTEIDIEDIQRKPEAPWILREDNSIKFTQKIQKFSRLQINNSELSKKDKNKKQTDEQPQDLNQGSQCLSDYHRSVGSLNQLRQKLKLDDQIENKLNKLLNKKK